MNTVLTSGLKGPRSPGTTGPRSSGPTGPRSSRPTGPTRGQPFGRAGRPGHHRGVAAFAVVVALIVAACGANDSTPSASTAGQTASPSAQTSPSASDSIASATPSPVSGASASPTASPSATPPASRPPANGVPYPLPALKVALRPVVSGLDAPVEALGADGRLFVVEQSGKIVIVSGGRVSGTFLDVSGRISCCGERGLLGLAFHPNYAANGRFFVRYTAPSGDVLIVEFHRSANPNRADPASGRVVLTIPHREFANHNGGAIAFGPDGKLYVGTGDGGSGGDPHGNGQNLGVLLGKMLRIDVDRNSGGAAYAVPADNPFRGQAGARPEIWAYGLRNPYSFTFDRETGDLWIGDVGQNAWEEVDRATAAGGLGRGANYGWNVMEAGHCYNDPGCDRSGKVLPLAEYGHSNGNGCAIIGGYVSRGSAYPELAGRYFFADDCSGRIWDLSAAGPSPQTPQLLLDTGIQILGWGQGSNGELYVTAANGTLYALE